MEVQFFLIFKDSNGLLEGTVFLTVNESNSTWHIAFIFFLSFNIYIFPACITTSLLTMVDHPRGRCKFVTRVIKERRRAKDHITGLLHG